MHELIAGLPTCGLHLHIGGTLEPELKLELASRNGVALPYASVQAMRAADDFDHLSSCLASYLTREELVQLQRNAFEVAWLDAADRDGFLVELDAFAAATGSSSSSV
jgi:adenine deaminase